MRRRRDTVQLVMLNAPIEALVRVEPLNAASVQMRWLLGLRNDVVDVLLVAPQRPGIAIGLITALNGAVKWLPITMRLHVPSEMVVPLEGL